MSRKLIISSIILLYAVMSFGSNVRGNFQKRAKPNFSGTWKLDSSKGNYEKLSGLKPGAELILVITHIDPEIKVTRKLTSEGQEFIQELVYYSDGRGETNPALFEVRELKSKTKWSGDKLATTYRAEPPRVSGSKITIYYGQVIEWKLSHNGKTLTRTNTPVTPDANSPYIPLIVKEVFNRVS